MMTAEQLKNSILQMALQGKLVPQDYTDEPAQKLLKRIREKKNTLINNKVVPKDKKMAEVSEDEQLFDIPENWVWTRIGELFQHNTGKALNGANKEGIILPYITTSNLHWNRFELDNLKEMPFTKAEMDKCTAVKGDLLVCEGGDYGRAAIWNYDFDIRIQNHVHKLRAYEKLCTEYFYYVFNFLKSTGQIKGKGIAIQGLSSGALHNLPVPLPTLREQYRIVEKIHEVLPEWNKYEAASTKLNTLNASFPEMMKKSILQEAVQGKLVPQDPNDEPASVLLKKIAEEKKRLIKEGKIKNQKPLPEITDDEIPFEIPEGWEWVRLGNILRLLTDGTHKTPHYVPSGVPFISVKDMSTGQVSFSNTKYITEEEARELNTRCNPEKGDILLSKVGTTGIPATVETDRLFSLFVSVALLKFNSNLIHPDYLKYMICSPVVQKQCAENTRGVGNKNWVMRDIANTVVPIPPYEEQARIVRELERILPQFIVLERSMRKR